MNFISCVNIINTEMTCSFLIASKNPQVYALTNMAREFLICSFMLAASGLQQCNFAFMCLTTASRYS